MQTLLTNYCNEPAYFPMACSSHPSHSGQIVLRSRAYCRRNDIPGHEGHLSWCHDLEKQKCRVWEDFVFGCEENKKQNKQQQQQQIFMSVSLCGSFVWQYIKYT